MGNATKKILKIPLDSIDSRSANFEIMRSLVRDHLPEQIKFDHRPYVIAFNALTKFNFRKGKYSIDNLPSIEQACIEVMQRSGIYLNGQLKPIYTNNRERADDHIRNFISQILGYYELPFDTLRELERIVKRDLNALLQLIETYEKDPIIRELKANGLKRNEHESKVKIDFYNRCIRERDVIVKFLASGIKARALQKASEDPRYKGIGTFTSEVYLDRPYKWWTFQKMEYFDYNRINVVAHRLENIRFYDAKRLQDLYVGGHKAKFYSQIKKIRSAEEIFDGILNYYMPLLPKIKEREAIFRELKTLFKSAKWYGFTALALTQVEGLFSDMVYIMRLPKKHNSLSTKVNAVRPHYEFEERNFDYFEYELPRHRNRFLHYGQIKEQNFKILAYDLLYDLHYLMLVFHGLKDPHVQLNRMLGNNTLEFIHGIFSLNDMFRLVHTIEERLKKNPNDPDLSATYENWKLFERDVLAPSKFVEFFLDQTNIHLDERVKNFYALTKNNSGYAGKEIDLENISIADLHKNKDDILLALNNAPFHDYDGYEITMQCWFFTNNYKKYLKHYSEEVKTMCDSINARHGETFKKLLFINPVLFPPSNGSTD